MNSTKIWYGIEDGADGTVSMNLYESEELAEIICEYDEYIFDDGGVGSISVLHEGSRIEIDEDVLTVDEAIEMTEKEISLETDTPYLDTLEGKLEKLNKLKEDKSDET